MMALTHSLKGGKKILTNGLDNMIYWFKQNGYNHTVMECIPKEMYRVHTLVNKLGCVLLYEHKGELLYFDYINIKCQEIEQLINS